MGIHDSPLQSHMQPTAYVLRRESRDAATDPPTADDLLPLREHSLSTTSTTASRTPSCARHRSFSPSLTSKDRCWCCGEKVVAKGDLIASKHAISSEKCVGRIGGC